MTDFIDSAIGDDARWHWQRSGDRLRGQHHALIPGVVMGVEANVAQDAWHDFADHWSRLTLDRYMGDGGTYRLRRYGQFDTRPDGSLVLRPHEPYEQPSSVNHLNGGVQRIFDPLEPSFASHRVLRSLLERLRSMVDGAAGRRTDWNIRLHPYRIVARDGVPGQPTPEGLHRDGVDYVVSLLVNRHNVTGGRTTVTDAHGETLATMTLDGPMSTLIADDTKTMHAVTAVEPKVRGRPAWRDVLVIAFTRLGVA
jgi:hypothetical protein